MRKKVVWLVVSGWMVAALLLTSCAPAVVEEGEEAVPKEGVAVPKEGANMVKWTGTKLDGTVVEKMIEKPKYGGTLNMWFETPPVNWDPYIRGGAHRTIGLLPASDPPLMVSLTRGPIGTNEWSGLITYHPAVDLLSGRLVESYEIPDDTTVIWHVRKGIHWSYDPNNEASRLVGGRQYTADDMVWYFRYVYNGGWLGKKYPSLADMENNENSIYVSPTDKWAVVFKFKPGEQASQFRVGGGYHGLMVAREVVEKYGPPITDWRHTVGTGPFILKNYIDATSLAYVRNPNYWGRDPFFPENQLPYLDRLNILFIPDRSTQMAAMRVGKIDTIYNAPMDDAKSLIKTSPHLKWKSYSPGTDQIAMRNDTKPFDDIRVRQALMLAINHQELVDAYYEGKAALFNWPVGAMADFSTMYTQLDKMPTKPTLPGSRASVQELYGYHPDKARQLLAEAGYPDGFTAKALAWSTEQIDLLSIVDDYWSKIGVDLEIQVRDYTVYRSILKKGTHPEMVIKRENNSSIWSISWGRSSNYSIIEDPLIEAMFLEIGRLYFEPDKQRLTMTAPMGEVLSKIPEAKGLPNWKVYTNEQVWYISLPGPTQYVFWQPWVKHFEGAHFTSPHEQTGWSRYVWIDQDLKKTMTR